MCLDANEYKCGKPIIVQRIWSTNCGCSISSVVAPTINHTLFALFYCMHGFKPDPNNWWVHLIIACCIPIYNHLSTYMDYISPLFIKLPGKWLQTVVRTISIRMCCNLLFPSIFISFWFIAPHNLIRTNQSSSAGVINEWVTTCPTQFLVTFSNLLQGINYPPVISYMECWKIHHL